MNIIFTDRLVTERHGVGSINGCRVRLNSAERGRGVRKSGAFPLFIFVPSGICLIFVLRRITSYINNLHPHQPHTQPFYSLLSRLISYVIPLWNRTLTSLRLDGGRRKTNPERIVYDGPEYFNESDEPSSDDGLDILWTWRDANLKPPEVNAWEIPGTGDYEGVDEETGRRWEEGVRLERKWRERGLQVIVKIANIELTPEKSEYEGGVWHVEGQLVRTCLRSIDPFIHDEN